MIHNVPIRRRGKHPLLYSSCAIIFAFTLTIYPTTVFAVDEPPPVDATTISSPAEGSTAPNTADTTSPTQIDASVPEPITETIPPSEEPIAPVEDPYILNETTGLWENSTYTWNPTTYQTAPKETPSYSYNPATNMWDTTQWQYNPTTGTYVESIVSTPSLPEGVTVESLSTDQPRLNNVLFQDSATAANKEATDTPTQPKGTFDLFFNASISNMFSSTAMSGDASVSGNTLGGDATTGDATAIATIINLLQSSWNYMAQGGLNTFVSSLFGNIFGDIMINPTLAATSPTSSDANISVNAASDAQIANDITLNATSGDADVTKNTEAGNATTGGAYAIANIINSISSYFGSGSSFIGILNIFGDLNGDILVPTDLKGLLSDPSPANVAPPSTDNTLTTTANQSAATTVEATALSGDATVSGNTSAGTASTGDASTALTVLNLTGRQIIGKNALLVFVNVFGNWIGLIVDNPIGTKSAALGDSSSSSTALPSEVNLSDNQSISNNLSLSATSGDATVSGNTSVGDATTGDAATAANVVNILSSNVSLTEWFGILFINIFGDWKGSFGVDTEAGEAPSPTTTTIQQPSVLAASTQAVVQQLSSNLRPQFAVVGSSNESSLDTNEATVDLASSPNTDNTDDFITDNAEPSVTKASPNYLFSTLATLTGLSILAGERIVTNRRRVLQR